jgi:hypothetical protein
MGRQAQAAANVTAQPKRRAVSGDDGGLAAAAPAGRPACVKGVYRPSVQWILTLIRHGDLRQVGLAQDNRPGLTQPGHKWRILIGPAVGTLGQPKRGWRSCQIEGFLDGDGQPMQRPE